MKKKRLLHFATYTALCLLLNFGAWGQQQAVRGTLRDSAGAPLIGATVTVKGTSTVAVTDANGVFTINAPTGATLVVTSVGFQSLEIPVTGAEINEVLRPRSAALNEVVVIGYQTVRRRDLTGATGVINTANTSRLTTS